jgi:DNA-directed RNA polymerase subunit M/transcription elongation factor TFIIS
MMAAAISAPPTHIAVDGFGAIPKNKLIGQRRVFDWRLSGMMSAIHRQTADKINQTCPKCTHSEILKTVRPADEQPRKNYCTGCGHEWWEFDKKPAPLNSPH